MKHILFLFSAIFLFIACSSPDLEENRSASSEVHSELTPNVVYPLRNSSRAGTQETGFWESWEQVKLPSGKPAVYTPWNKKNASVIPQDIREDIKYSNGWRLIAYTIGGPNEEVKGDDFLNYMLFYNRYTGILKVFYYLESSSMQNTGMWKLHFETPQSLLAFSDQYATISSDKTKSDVYVSNITNNDTKAFENGWNCFQVELAYDPSFTEGSLQLIPMSINTSSIEIEGKAISETKGMIISTTSNPLSGIVKAVATGAGKDAEKYVGSLISDGKFKNIKNLVMSGAGTIVSSGVSSLLGSFVGGFLKSGQTTLSVQLHTDTQINLKGSITTISSGLVKPLTISLSVKDVGRLGVWCLTKEPFFNLLPYVRYKGKWYSQDWYAYEIQTLPDLLNFDKVVLNPDLGVSNVLKKIDTYLRRESITQALGSFGYSNKSMMTEPRTDEKLYEDTYKGAGATFTIAFPIRNKYGTILKNLPSSKIPQRAFIPDVPDGTKGVDAKTNTSSNVKYVYTVSFTLPDGSTVSSSHTFIPKLVWDTRQFQSDRSYKSMYPKVQVNN